MIDEFWNLPFFCQYQALFNILTTMAVSKPDPKYSTFDALYDHILTLKPPLFPPGKATSPSLTSSISALSLHPTLEAALHILNNDLPRSVYSYQIYTSL